MLFVPCYFHFFLVTPKKKKENDFCVSTLCRKDNPFILNFLDNFIEHQLIVYMCVESILFH
jgi:hypothetical protein